MKPTLSMIPLLLTSSIAMAADQKPITSGEFFDRSNGATTAHTLEKGEFAYHPLFHASALGLSDSMDLKFRTLGLLLGGPGVGTEYAFVQDDDQAISLDVWVDGTWNFASYNSSGSLRYTTAMGDNRLNASVGGSYQQITITTTDFEGNETSTSGTAVEVPITLGYDMVTSETNTLTFSTHINTLQLIDGVGILAIPHFGWAHGFGEKFRLALGLNLPIGGLDQGFIDFMSTVGMDVPKNVVLPLPYFQIWWKH